MLRMFQEAFYVLFIIIYHICAMMRHNATLICLHYWHTFGISLLIIAFLIYLMQYLSFSCVPITYLLFLSYNLCASARIILTHGFIHLYIYTGRFNNTKEETSAPLVLTRFDCEHTC